MSELSPYEQGMADFHKGQDKNPHMPYTQAYEDWAEGWDRAARSFSD